MIVLPREFAIVKSVDFLMNLARCGAAICADASLLALVS